VTLVAHSNVMSTENTSIFNRPSHEPEELGTIYEVFNKFRVIRTMGVKGGLQQLKIMMLISQNSNSTTCVSFTITDH